MEQIWAPEGRRCHQLSHQCEGLPFKGDDVRLPMLALGWGPRDHTALEIDESPLSSSELPLADAVLIGESHEGV